MSAEAIATLRRIWEKLSFHQVKRVIAREPEDVFSISIHRDDGHVSHYIKSNRTADIPEEDRRRARVTWRHYYGFTDDGIYFQKDSYHGLDYDISLTMDWSEWANHTGGYDKPEIGSLICGEVIDTPRGKRFKRWFDCRPEFKFLADIVLNGTSLSEEELGRRLVTEDYPDKYWAIARLVLFDNVQAFVDEVQWVHTEPRPPHPAHGLFSGTVMFPSGKRLTVGHTGMWLSMGAMQFVHTLSAQLNEPGWRKTWQQLTTKENAP